MEELVKQMKGNPKNVRFADLCKVCEHYFGESRRRGSHQTHKTPWQGNPRINIQDDGGKAKAYQVNQVIKAIERLKEEHGAGKV